MTIKNTNLYPIAATYKYNGAEFPINFKSEIGIGEVGALIQLITSEIVDEYGYHPYAYDTSLYGRILSFLSDFDTADIIELDKILRQSDIKDVIRSNVDDFGKISNYVDESITFQKQKLANKSEFDGLISDIRSVINSDMLEKAETTFNKAYDKINYILNNVEPEVIAQCIKNIGQANMSVSDIVSVLFPIKSKDKSTSKNDSNKNKTKGKIINLVGQQNFDGTELVQDEIK